MHTARTLTELQEQDLLIIRLEKELEEMPEKRAILTARAKLADIDKLRERTQAAIHAMDAVSKRIEDQIAALSTKMTAEQAKLATGEVSNAKEVQAVSLELDSLSKRVAALEGELLAEMQKRENGEAQLAKIDAALAEGHRAEATLMGRFQERGGEIIGRIEAAKRARAGLITALGAELSAHYESLRASHHGVAVATLDGAMCTGCRVTLPSVRVLALENGPDIGSCPGCGRILIVRGE
jgi:predicted  nucleic acid-binding Zn-ribbon protein